MSTAWDHFRCKACGTWRPPEQIAVHTVDNSAAMGWPWGTLRENFNYCVDNPRCRRTALEWKGNIQLVEKES